MRNALEAIDSNGEHEALVNVGLVGYEDETSLTTAIDALRDNLVTELRK